MNNNRDFLEVSPLLHKFNKSSYLYGNTSLVNDPFQTKGSLDFPVVIDTEFDFRERLGTGKGRLPLTVQVKGIGEGAPSLIYDHKEFIEYCREVGKYPKYLPMMENFAPIQYLNDATPYKWSLFKYDGKVPKLPSLTVVIYGHFLLAELNLIATGQVKESLKKLQRDSKGWSSIEQGRRLKATLALPESDYHQDRIALNPWTVIVKSEDGESKEYKLKIKFVDTSAIHGQVSYHDLGKNTGTELDAKDNFTSEEKGKMAEQYFSRPDDFKAYALGDLKSYEMLENNAEKMSEVYENLGLSDYFELPKLSIGSTTASLFRSALFNYLGIASQDKDSQEYILDLCKLASASELKYKVNSTESLLAKVFGGRCRNNRPLTTVLNTMIADLDIAGCYGNGLRFQDYPIGNPVIEGLRKTDNDSLIKNDYDSLRVWLKKRKYNPKTLEKKANCELVDGLWTAIVSGKLSYPQDLIASWYGFKMKDIPNMKADCDLEDSQELDPKTGQTKIFQYEIENGVITSEFIDWLKHIASKKQRDDMLDNLYIQSACYYPAYGKVESFKELSARLNQYDATVESKQENDSQTATTVKKPTVWIAVNLGELLVDNLLANRKMYPKKTPLNTLFKLITNSLYGDFCSPYFDISNVVVGNNITARARMMCYLMEKGLNGVLSITDGCQFEVLKVVYSNKGLKVNAQTLTNLYQYKDVTKRNLKLSALTGLENAELVLKEGQFYFQSGDEIIGNACEIIDNLAMSHLQNLFPTMPLLTKLSKGLKVEKSEDGKPIKHYLEQSGIYSFETKSLYSKGTFHATANYTLESEKEYHIAMRSYENKKRHLAAKLTDGKIDYSDFGELSPGQTFLKNLENPDNIPRSKVFIKDGILKTGDYKQNSKKYDEMGLEPGDTIKKSGLLRELSLSQFTYKTKEQWQAIEKQGQQNKRKYGQTFEMFFLNTDGSLNYQKMIETIDGLIQQGCQDINGVFDLNRHKHRYAKHPEIECLDAVRIAILNDKPFKVQAKDGTEKSEFEVSEIEYLDLDDLEDFDLEDYDPPSLNELETIDLDIDDLDL